MPKRASWSFSGPAGAQVKHAVKSGVAATLAVLGHQHLPLPDRSHGAWAAVSALIVMQSNLGSSWKASGQRLLGTAVGALTGAVFTWLLGGAVLWLGAAVCVTLLVCSWLGLRESLRLAGATLVLVMLSGKDADPWLIAGQRFVDVVLGIVSALLIQTVLWPSRAGSKLRQELSAALAAGGRLYRPLVASCLNGTYRQQDLDEPRAELRQALQRAQGLVKDWQSEPMRQRPEDLVLPALVGQVEGVGHHLLAVDRAARGMEHDTFYQQLRPRLDELARAAGEAFDWLALALTSRELPGSPPQLDATLTAVDEAFDRQRQTRASSAFATEEVLRFSTFFFNLREVTSGLRAIEGVVRGEGLLPAPPGRRNEEAPDGPRPSGSTPTTSFSPAEAAAAAVACSDRPRRRPALPRSPAAPPGRDPPRR
jgi:uncharacterized membrane protein YccC